MANICNFRQIKHKFYQTLADERGATMLEYSVIIASFGFAIAGGVTLIGSEFAAIFSEGLLPAFGIQASDIEVDK